ncbi:MAG: hypothetical protein K8F91_16750 [Candidatus Obscuribacterales bacterium]|nr:hypothetical protein [Candidatus Obscuribacterales bacterium]
MTSITFQGQIEQLDLPDSWKERELAQNELKTFELREFSPSGEEEVKLCFYYRGRQVSEGSGLAFLEILKRPPHLLMKQEIESIVEILEEIAFPESFAPLGIKTEKLNQKMVLIVDGRWRAQSWDTHALYIPADKHARVVQQVYLLSPPSRYPVFLSQFKAALEAISWRADSILA